MSTYYLYKLVHLTGIFFLFSTLGGHMFSASLGTRKDNPMPKFMSIFQKIGLLLVLLGGLGLLTHIGDFSSFGWIIIKFFVLAMLAMWHLYLYGAKEKLPLMGGAAIILGLVAAIFALYKPF
ncbi:MAG: hypothetical protein D6B25_05695 [Desulfobulbaceae bacterium]|nr:MAG: hypothetical protein D6B25_05695 [Desulfobulbaceae bacterium]